MPDFADPQIWISLLTLTVLEIVLGIDNLIFISILADKLPEGQQNKARTVGLMLALGTRILLLCTLFILVGLVQPLFTILGQAFSGKDLVLLGGGLFLIAKSVHEIHGKLEGEEGESSRRIAANFTGVIVQIVLIDIVFSLDSVITAVGLVKNIAVMITAVVLAMVVMIASAGAISGFVNRHPTIKMLALSFLLLIGVMLVAEAFHREIPKGYIYFSMAFAVGVEMLNIKMRKRAQPVHLHQPYQ
jgi:predicted tellurium resistance membrane protein TerC